MTDQILKQTVTQALTGAGHVLLALSGGLDSCVLLQLLLSLRASQAISSLRACHIHHGLTAQADEWAQFCQRLCHCLQVEYHCQSVVISAEAAPVHLGVEAAARTVRYAALAQHLHPGETLVTAHHQEDQAETLLLALKRGSGPAGLAAMALKRSFAAGYLCRPLLKVPRSALLAYAKRHDLLWVEDSSNQSLHFDRNFLRHVILPQLSTRWPSFSETTARSAQLCAEQEQLLDELLQPVLQQWLAADHSVAIADLANCSERKRHALLRRWCRLLAAPTPTHRDLLQLWHSVALSRCDANPQLQLGQGWQVRRFAQRLYLLAPQLPLPAAIAWNISSARFLSASSSLTLPLPAGLGSLVLQRAGVDTQQAIRPPDKAQRVTIRFGLLGRLRIAGRGLRRLKKIYQEQAIPPWLRPRLPVLYYDELPIAIPGVWVTEAGLAITTTTAATSALQLIWKCHQPKTCRLTDPEITVASTVAFG